MQPYPAQQLAMADMAGMDHSCFDEEDEEKSAELGYKVCKTGQEDCRAPAIFTIPAMKTPVVPSGETLLAGYHPSTPLSNASSFWRPPRF